MDVLLLLVRLGLAGVFLVSGVAKLRALSGFRRTLSDFGLPGAAARSLAPVIPIAEVGTAGGLVVVATAWFAAVSALGLLLIFTAAMAVNMARGRRPNCHCFGQLSAKPIGWHSIWRNVALALAAGLIAWFGKTNPGGSAVGWVLLLTIGQRVLLSASLFGLLLLGGIAWLLMQILAQQGRLLLRLDALEAQFGLASASVPTENVPEDQPVTAGLPVGRRAPAFRLSDLAGRLVSLDSLLARGKPVLLAFIDPNCGPCNALLPDLSLWQREKAGSLTLAILSRGSVEANQAKASAHELQDLLLQKDHEVAEAYGTDATPAVVFVRPDGLIGSPAAVGQPAITQLLAQLENLLSAPRPSQPSPTPPAPARQNGRSAHLPDARPGPGRQAPPIQLPDLDGKMVSLEHYRGAETLVLFWSPHCGYCKEMLADLKAWEDNTPKGAPRLLVVSTGAVADNRAMGLRSPVVLDTHFAVGSAYGASGTPSAVLIDHQGNIASEVTVGASAVLKLAYGDHPA